MNNIFLNRLLQRLKLREGPSSARAKIVKPRGALAPDHGERVCVFVVGPTFDQEVPTAMMTCRMGYAHAFETLGIPYLFVDQQDLLKILPHLHEPFCMVNGSDYLYMEQPTLKVLKRHPHCVWVDPWFHDSDRFFAVHDLDARIWAWSGEHRRKILETEPRFVHTATVATGLHFFSEWHNQGLKVISLPLACDTFLYQPEGNYVHRFNGVKLAFVGGYWESKGKQIDRYLRPFEDDLVVYGYSKWPYRGYRGLLPVADEPALYRQATVAPVINEPSVAILHGQINERIFKVLGSGGYPLVDAVPAYRELFSEAELPIPEDADHFRQMLHEILDNGASREQCALARQAVLEQHTYQHRALQVLSEMGLGLTGDIVGN